MDMERTIDNEQVTLWNGSAGRAWVETQELLDQMFKPLEDVLVEALLGGSARDVLDIGCGTGSTTLAAARALPNGQCVGIDISEPMITAARARAGRECTPATFIHDNAQTHAFEPASVDAFISRFGVMFFDDNLLAFSNLRHAARDNAHLRFIVWRDPAENPFMTTAERAAAPLLDVPTRQTDAPGQFAFADRSKVHRILKDSGWAEIDVRPLDVVCVFPESGLIHYLTRLGPLARLLDGAEEQLRNHVIETARAAFNSYVHGSEVRFIAACWQIDARARSAST